MSLINPNQKETLLLPAGQILTLANPSGSAGLAVRLSRVPGGGDSQSTTVLAGTDTTLGPYTQPERFSVSCSAGSVTYSMAPVDPTTISYDDEAAALIALKLNKLGSATNDAATAGQIGELKSTTIAFANIVSVTTATPVNVASLSLTAGDWDVSAVVNHAMTGATPTVMGAAISPTTGVIPAQAGGSGIGPDSLVSQMATFGTEMTGNYITAIGPVRVSLASTTTIYLVAADTFSAGTVGVFGTIRARRMR